MESFGVAQLERQAKQEGTGIRAHLSHQAEQRRVRADEDVLAVVERAPPGVHPPSSAPGDRTAFEYGDANAALRERNCRRNAGVARPNNGYVRSQVEIAIQNLRTGVSEVRWLSTLKPSAATSSSTVR